MNNDHLQNPNLLTEICRQFEEKYPKPKLRKAISDFRWGNESPIESLRKRRELSSQYRSWITQGAPIRNALDMADAVMRWGFGNSSPRVLHKNITHFCEFNKAWNEENSFMKMQSTLIENLDLRGIGIARSSKWICFIDEKRYAIYDSRVSAALRSIKIETRQVFPTVERRSTKSRDFPRPNHRSNAQMAKDYVLFIHLVRRISEEYELNTAAEVEMGLFMLGDDPNNW